MNKDQLVAATYSGKHLLVLAGAGTGKTRTIIARAIYLLNNGISAERIKILSFTNKATKEIVSRIKIESNDNVKVKGLNGATFHSWCMELLKKYAHNFRTEGVTCIDSDDSETAFKLVMGHIFGKQTLDINTRCRLSPSTISDIYSYAVNTRSNLTDSICAFFQLSPDDRAQKKSIEHIRTICQMVIQGYIDYKRQRRYIDYDDMLSVVALGLKKNKSLRDKITSQYDHILIDEMQDTNPLQWILLESFYDNCHLFCVGDDAQSIYAFRGADFKSIHSFKSRVPQSEVLHLTENYRSSQEILNVANWVLGKSPLSYGKQLIAHRGHGKKPILYLLNSHWEESNIIADAIQKGVIDGRKYKDYLILARSAFSCRNIEATCISRGIPYVFFGGTQLMKSAHVRDVISALRIISNHYDELAWIRYLTLWPGVGEVSAAKIIDQIVNYSDVAEAINNIRLEKHHPSLIRETLEDLIELVKCPSQAIDVVVKRMEIVLSKKYDNWDIRKSDFEALKIVASNCNDVTSFLEEYVLDPSAEQTVKIESNLNKDAIIISTIHSAKGLEADTCFIINVTPESYPLPKAMTDEEIEEERRCLYVALTRAKNSLNIMSRKFSVTGMSNRSHLKGIKFYSTPYCEDIVGTIEGTILKGWNENLRRLEHFYLIKMQESQETIQILDEEFKRKYYIKPDDSSVGRYFLNGINISLVDYYTENAQDGIQDNGYVSEWNPKCDTPANDIMNDFNFS